MIVRAHAPDGPADAGRDLERARLLGARQDERELVAAVAEDLVRVATGRAQRVGDVR